MRKWIVPGAMGFSALWILGVLAYVTSFFGWQNLTYLLPSELAVVVLALFLPVIVGVVVILVLEIANKVDGLARSIGGQTSAITEMAQQVTAAVDDARRDRELLPTTGDLQTVLTHAISGAISGAIEAQGAFRPPAVQGGVSAESLNPNDIGHVGTLITLFNVALNDLSVITTRLLVRLLEDEGSGKEDVRAFITGLLDAYSTGDKNVFFRALRRQLESDPAHLERFKALATTAPDVRTDISKILREAEEIMSMVQRCDRQNLIRIVFEDGELWGLQQYLTRHFEIEGSARADTDGGQDEPSPS
ncbi:MAG: hypothetical protein HQL34_11940 [Alphaproteobacteria bacterium]|nr:hypothetical protein [Alphaproteobacteria bacterium]